MMFLDCCQLMAPRYTTPLSAPRSVGAVYGSGIEPSLGVPAKSPLSGCASVREKKYTRAPAVRLSLSTGSYLNSPKMADCLIHATPLPSNKLSPATGPVIDSKARENPGTTNEMSVQPF